MARYLIMILIILLLISLVGGYVHSKIGRIITFFGKDKNSKKWRRIKNGVVVLFVIMTINFLSNTAVIMLHLIIISAVIDLIALIARRVYGTREQGKIFKACRFAHQSGIVALLLTVVIVVYGIANMYHVRETAYVVETTKDVRDYKIELVTDVHYDTIQSPEVLKNVIEKINKAQPDIVLLGGDIVEEGTSKERMKEVFKLLGEIENKYGIYFVYGNHDRQPYIEDPTYSDAELEDAITSNNIIILEDDYIEINDDLILAGRADVAMKNTNKRQTSEEILKNVDRKKFILMLDHQPVEVEENNLAGVDLELSGHTHAGQIWPVGFVTDLIGLNYGEYKEGNCTAIVSSGVAGWGYKLRTSGHCEYVMLEIQSTTQ